jgi:hypothetical protein
MQIVVAQTLKLTPLTLDRAGNSSTTLTHK